MGRGIDGPCALRDARVRYRSGPDGQRTFLSDKEGTKGPRSLGCRSSDRRSLRASRCFCSSSCRAFFGDCPRLPVSGSGRPLERMVARRFDPVGGCLDAFFSDRTAVTPTTVGKAGAWSAILSLLSVCERRPVCLASSGGFSLAAGSGRYVRQGAGTPRRAETRESRPFVAFFRGVTR